MQKNPTLPVALTAMKGAVMIARFLLLTSCLIACSGCSLSSKLSNRVTNFSEAVSQKAQLHQELEEQRAELRKLQHEAKLAQQKQCQEERLRRMEQCVGKTIPELETGLGLKLRQRFELGEPELDVAEAQTMMSELTEDHERQMTVYKDRLEQWKINRDHFYKAQKSLGVVSTQASGTDCGLPAPCDDTYAMTYSVPRPERPKLQVNAQQIPLKLSVRIGTKIDSAEFDEFRTRQIPVRQQTTTRRVPCRSCQRTTCDDFACLQSSPTTLSAGPATTNEMASTQVAAAPSTDTEQSQTSQALLMEKMVEAQAVQAQVQQQSQTETDPLQNVQPVSYLLDQAAPSQLPY